MKKLIVILLFMEFLTAFVAPSCYLRGEQLRAIRGYYETATKETKVEMEMQNQITMWNRLRLSVILFCSMAGITLLGAYVWKKLRSNQTLHPTPFGRG